MTIASAKNTPRNTYTATGGQTVFTIGFEFFNTSDIKVFRNGSALTFNAAPSSVAQFSVQGTANASDSAYEFGAGGTITLGGGATADDSIVIVRDITVERLTDFTPAASFDVTALNTQLDTLMAMMAEREESTSRSIRLPLAETTTGFDMQLPVKASRANKVLEFDSDGDPACTITASNLSTLGTITGDITTVAGISSNVTTVAGIQANVTTVAGISSNVTSVAGVASLITSDFVSDLNTLAVTDVVNDINTLATSDIVSDLNTLATSDIVSDINTLATSDIVSDLNTLATSDIVTDLNLLATSANVTNMATLGASGVVSNIASVAGSIANVNTTASNISGVNSFAERYRVASSDPGSDNDAGDLVFNTSSNILKVYNGSSFDDVTGSTLAGLSDTNITSPADGSILLYDTGTSKYIDNVISGDATLADTGALTIAADAITGAKIADDAINSEHYTDGSIDTAHLSADCVTGAKIADDAINSEHYTDGSIDTAHIGDAQVTLAKLAADAIPTPLRPNVYPLIYNGEMHIVQYGNKTGITATQYVCDRFCTQMDTFGTWSMSQDTSVPTGKGYRKSVKLDCTTADTSLGAGHFGLLRTAFEGQDLQLLKKGTSSAEKLTLKFYVKSAKTGTYTVEFFDTDNSRQISKTYTVDSANTWEEKIINIPADTTGALTNDTNESFVINWWLGSGSNYNSGTLNSSSWASSTNANRVSSSNVNLADNTSNDWFLTGVQLEIGEFTSSTIPAFQHEEFAESLIRCQRYFIPGSGDFSMVPPAQQTATQTVQSLIQFRTQMRTAPTLTYNASGGFGLVGGSYNTTGLVVSSMGVNGGRIAFSIDTNIGSIFQFCQQALAADHFADLLAQS